MKENIKSTNFSCNFATETPHTSNIDEMCEEGNKLKISGF